MSSSLQSQSKTEELFHLQPNKVIPAFGLHPWYTGTISTDGNLDKLTHYSRVLCGKKKKSNTLTHGVSHQLQPESHDQEDTEEIQSWIHAHLEQLPNPMRLDEFLSDLKSRLLKYPSSIVGEIGLDKAFQFHLDLSSSASTRQHEENDDREKQILKTDFKLSIEHQLIILQSQIELAIELSRPISLHCVQAPTELLDLFQNLKDKWGVRFTGIKAATNSNSSRKKQLNKKSPSFSNGDIKKPDSLLHDPDPARLVDKKCLLDQAKSQLDFAGASDHGQDSLLASNRFKICWHSPNISVEILQRALKIVPKIMYFSYSNDLAVLFNAKRRPQTEEKKEEDLEIKEIDWNKSYSKRIGNSIRATPTDQLLIESDHGSDPASMDGKLINILRWIHFLQRSVDPATLLNDPPDDALHRLVAQIQSNWNQFYCFPPPPC